MTKSYLAVGPSKYWQIAFKYGCIWGLKATAKHVTFWEGLSTGDYILFYVTTPISGVIGYGVIHTKFRQDKPLWPQEVEENRVIWPYRFEFGVEYALAQDKWKTDKVASSLLKPFVKGGFQVIPENLATEVIKAFPSEKVVTAAKKPVSLHEEIKENLIEIGHLQNMLAEGEYNMAGERLDVVWRRIERAVPTYVFEIQIGGDLYHAIGKLKHAFDLWNSNIFLVISEEDINKAKELLAGTFHEIEHKIKVIKAKEVGELLTHKRVYRDFETKLGIL